MEGASLKGMKFNLCNLPPKALKFSPGTISYMVWLGGLLYTAVGGKWGFSFHGGNFPRKDPVTSLLIIKLVKHYSDGVGKR